MRDVIIIFYVILITFTLSFSQDNYKLYEHLMPVSEKFPPGFIEYIDYSIETYAALNPNLIYYFIQHVNNNYRFTTEKKLPTFKWLKFLEYKARLKKNRWIKNEIDKAAENSTDDKSKLVQWYLKKFLVDPEKPDSIFVRHTQKNEISFYTYIYLSKNRNLTYDPAINYADLCNTEYQKTVTQIESFYTLSKNDVNNLDKALQWATAFPYLFEKSYLDYIKTGTKFPIYKLIENNIDDAYDIPDKLYIGIGPDFTKQTIHHRFEILDLIESNHQDITIKSQTPIEFMIGYKMQISRVPEMFHQLDIAVGFATFYNASSNRDGTVLLAGDKYVPGVGSLSGSFLLKETTSKSYGIFAEILTPVFIFIPQTIYLNGGIKYNYAQTDIHLQTEIQGEFTYLGPKEAIIKKDFKEENNIVSALIAVVFEPSRYFTFNMGLRLPFYKSYKKIYASASLGLALNWPL